MTRRLPKFLLWIFLGVLILMIISNICYDAMIPTDRHLSHYSVYTLVPKSEAVEENNIIFGRIPLFHHGTIIFPDPLTAKNYLKDQKLDEQQWQIYALAGHYLEDTYPVGNQRYSKVAMRVKSRLDHY